MTRRWVHALAAAVGVVLIGVAVLVWWTAEQALPPAPKVHWSSQGGMSRCEGAPVSCEPPVIPTGTVAVIVVLAVAGVALVAAVLVDAARRRGARPATAG